MSFNIRRPSFKKAPRFVLVLLGLLLIAGCAGAPIRPWSGAVSSGDNLYVGTLDGQVVALSNVSSGNPRVVWAEEAQSQGGGDALGCGRGTSVPMALYSTPTLAEGRVYIGGYGGYLYSFDARDGSRKEYNTRSAIVGGVAVANGSVFVGTSDGKLLAFDSQLGFKWEFKTGDKIWSTPVVNDGVVFVTSSDHKLYALDAATGVEIWHLTTGAGVMSTPVVHEGVVYVGSVDWVFYAVDVPSQSERQAAADRESGAKASEKDPKWVFEKATSWYWTEALVHEGKVWAGNLDGNLYAINLGNPDDSRTYAIGSPIRSKPLVMDGNVIVASEEGGLYVIDTQSHSVRQLWAVTTDPDKDASITAPIYGDPEAGLIYVHAWIDEGDSKDRLYGIESSTGKVFFEFSLNGI